MDISLHCNFKASSCEKSEVKSPNYQKQEGKKNPKRISTPFLRVQVAEYSHPSPGSLTH